jgi:excisionase family DNA binding protein
MVPSTKLITIREAANRLGLKESTIRKYILKRQIAYVKPSVRAVRIPIEELERILAAGLRPVIPQGKVPDEPLEGVSAGARRRRMDQEAETGLSPGAVAALVLGMSSIPSPLGHLVHGRRRGCREADLSSQATPATDRTPARLSGVGVLPGPDGGRAWRPPYLLGLAGAGWGTRPPVLDLPGMALGPMASPPRGSGGLDQGLSAKPSVSEPSEPLRHQPIRPGSMWLCEYVLVLETVSWAFPSAGCGKKCGINGLPGTPTDELGVRSKSLESSFIKTWEDLLSGHPIWFSGTILQLVLGKGLVYQEV